MPRNRDDRQMDLFDPPVAHSAAHSAAPSPTPAPDPAPDPTLLGDADLVARFLTASVAEVALLGTELG
jgi:hypothetical protein